MEAFGIIEAHVSLQTSLPSLDHTRQYPVPVFLLHGALHPFYLPVEVGRPWPDPDMADASLLEEMGECLAELRAVICLNAADREGDALQKTR